MLKMMLNFGNKSSSGSSGLGGLAQSFLGSGGNSSSHGSGGLVGQLAGSLLNSGKPSHSSSSSGQGQGSAWSPAGGSSSGGGFLSNLLGGNHGSVSDYIYSFVT